MSVRVGLTNGVQVLVHCKAKDTDSAVIRRAILEGSDGDPMVTIDWMISETELTSPPPSRFVHPMVILEPSAPQLRDLEGKLLAAQQRLKHLKSDRPQSPIDAARRPQQISLAELDIDTLKEQVAFMRRRLAS